jgi:TonB family protein
MKTREITNNELEQMFNKVVEQTPLISEEQVNTLLHSLPKTKLGKAGKGFFQSHLNIIILGSIVLSIVVGAIIWLSSGHKTETAVTQRILMETKTSQAIIDTITVKPAVSIKNDLVQNAVSKDITLETFSVKSDSVPVQTNPKISVSDIYKDYAKKPQVFTFRANRDTTIICNEGTSIKIKASSFISEITCNEITGNVQFAVKEYYKISDIILSKLSTTSGNKILETAGMLHISVSADDENCIIKQGGDIEIGFPHLIKKDDMALFYGEWTNDKIDWKLANKQKEEENMEVFFIVEDMPEFPGGDLALRRYIEENMRYPVDAAENGFQGKVYVSFIIDKNGSTSQVSIARGVHPSLDREALRVVSSLPKWKPGRQRGKPVCVSYTVPVNFDLGHVALTKEEFETKVKDDNFQEINVSDVNRYFFNVSQVGWINCDRYSRNIGSITDYSISIDEPEKTIVTMIFHRLKTVLPGFIKSKRVTFYRVPLGEKVTIVAFKTVDNNILLAIKETVITNTVETGLDFQPVTMDLLKKEMEKLNKIN